MINFFKLIKKYKRLYFININLQKFINKRQRIDKLMKFIIFLKFVVKVIIKSRCKQSLKLVILLKLITSSKFIAKIILKSRRDKLLKLILLIIIYIFQSKVIIILSSNNYYY